MRSVIGESVIVGSRVPIMGRCGVCQGVSNHSSLVPCSFTILNVILPVVLNGAGRVVRQVLCLAGKRKETTLGKGRSYNVPVMLDD